MIKGVHALFDTTDPEGARAFLRDKFRLPHTDAGDGWLIFDLPAGDVGCHPAERPAHAISFYTDDLSATMEDAASRGVEFTPVIEEEWGRTTTFELPGGGPVMIYEPKYKKGA